MRFGIPEKSMTIIIETIKQFKEIEKVSIFGSRAIGNYKSGSDIDLVIHGSNVTDETVNKLSIRLNEELPLPFYFDIVHYGSLAVEALKEHIDNYSKTFYSK